MAGRSPRPAGNGGSDTPDDPGVDAGAALKDWAQLISFTPELVLRPDEHRRVKAHAGEDRTGASWVTVRCGCRGSLHSCARIVVSDDHPRHLGRCQGDRVRGRGNAVTATANVTLHEFLAEARRRGKSLTATGGTDHQTLAGLISTGTAPASPRHALYDLLEWVELVTVDATTGKRGASGASPVATPTSPRRSARSDCSASSPASTSASSTS